MTGVLATAGESLDVTSSLDWVSELIAEGAGAEFETAAAVDATVRVAVETSGSPFTVGRWELLSRGAWHRGNEVVLENVCTSGFDLHVRCENGRATFTYRWRPPSRDRVAARVLRSRFHLLARAALLQYPVLWWAGTRGRAPLHASVCTSPAGPALVTAQSGVGRSTLIMAETSAGASTTGDNLGVGDGTSFWGLAEPARVKGGTGTGRRMPHGRQERILPNRIAALDPACVVMLVRSAAEAVSGSECDPELAARALVTSTYMAGELRRYWSFAAALAAGTSLGPPHPPVAEVATAFVESLPCYSLALGRTPRACLAEVLEAARVAA